MFVCTYIYMFVWVYTGEVNAKRVRERYLQAVLRQDIQYFDKVGAGEVATRITTDTRTLSSTRGLFSRSYFYPQISCNKAPQRRLLWLSTFWRHSSPVSFLPMLGVGDSR